MKLLPCTCLLPVFLAQVDSTWLSAFLNVGFPRATKDHKVLILKWSTSKPRPGLFQVDSHQMLMAPYPIQQAPGGARKRRGVLFLRKRMKWPSPP